MSIGWMLHTELDVAMSLLGVDLLVMAGWMSVRLEDALRAWGSWESGTGPGVHAVVSEPAMFS